jgi:hypothetical protein
MLPNDGVFDEVFQGGWRCSRMTVCLMKCSKEADDAPE